MTNEVKANQIMLAIRHAIKEHVNAYSDEKIEKIFKSLKPKDQAYDKYATKRMVVAVLYMKKAVKTKRADDTFDVIINKTLGIDKDLHLYMVSNPEKRVELTKMDDYIANKTGSLSVIIEVLRKFNLI